MRRRPAIVSVVAVLFTVCLSASGPGSAASAPNHGFPVLGSACGLENALSVNTPVAARYARLACLADAGGGLVWTRAPEESRPCRVDRQVWGSLTCAGGRWGTKGATFSGDLAAALAELADVVASTRAWSPSGPQAPSGSKYVQLGYERSPVDVELRDRLATAGFELSRSRGTYVVRQGNVVECRKWIDPWPADFAGERGLRPDAMRRVRCPTGDVSVVYPELEAIALEAGALYHTDRNAFLAREPEFEQRIADVGYTGYFGITSDNYRDEPLPDLLFIITDSYNCLRYVHNNGAPYLDMVVTRSCP